MENEEKARVSHRYKYNRMILVRVLILTGIFGFAMFIPLALKLYDVAIAQHDELERKAIDQQMSSYPITVGRGTIYDRNKNVLAVSASVETVCVSPRDIPADKEKFIADGLSEILGIDSDGILDRIEKGKKNNRANEKIKEQVEREEADKVRAFILANKLSSGKPMIFLQPGSKRYYPNGSFASNIIGFVGAENTGLMGLEAVYNKQLSGTPGRTVAARDSGGRSLPNQYEMYYDALEGYDLVLTIDETIQHFAEKHLETAVIENEAANRGCVIIMDVRTGGILAMATKGDFDLNEPREIADEDIRRELESLGADVYPEALGEAQQAQWRNKAVNDTYEPGSVFKIFTAAMALEEKVVNESDRFNCTGSIEAGGHIIRCHKIAGHGSQTFLESLLHSCNPAFVAIGDRVGPEKFYDYMRAFGFMEPTGIDLQGEARAIIAPYETYSRQASARAVYSFGQTFKVTPIQMITAVCAVANGGYLMKPYVLSQVAGKDGRVVEKNDPAPVRQVISAETSRTMCAYLEECINQGTGSNAYVKGYHVAGKTGTSQKRDIPDADELGLYVVSFAGFAPANDPQVAILVMLDEPGLDRAQRMGGYMAAPVAGRIFADVLPYLGVIPQYKEGEAMSVDVTVPFVKKSPVSDAEKAAKKEGLTVRVIGDGDTVTDQLPAAGVLVPASTEMILYTEGIKPSETVTVPNVIGKTPEQANAEMTNAGVFMRPIGAQRTPDAYLTAAWQEFAGQEVPYGSVVSVEFRSTDVHD
ncbi:MAG: PASTA domain-containing protein [Oscillospiraceae bacterium]|jgi:stage V sporulation protein D (sporulation-specific penicillin-binding protein)|nr:PASTA domain-containing protein [Oscillospiraceae bacterium]